MAKAGQRMLAWTVCAYKKAGIEEGYWHRYMSKTHAPLVKEALARHGITRYSMVNHTHQAPTLPLHQEELIDPSNRHTTYQLQGHFSHKFEMGNLSMMQNTIS